MGYRIRINNRTLPGIYEYSSDAIEAFLRIPGIEKGEIMPGNPIRDVVIYCEDEPNIITNLVFNDTKFYPGDRFIYPVYDNPSNWHTDGYYYGDLRKFEGNV